MQPYQEASEEIRRQGNRPLELAKNAATLAGAAGTAYFAGSNLGRVLPFLSKYVPEDLAIKGLNKIDPRFGDFINKAQSAGQSFGEIKDFISGKAEEGMQAQSEKKGNIIEQYSPELHRFLSEKIQSGVSPFTAAGLAMMTHLGTDFKSVIEKIKKDHKVPWIDIVESIYGGQAPQQQGQAQPPTPPNNPGQSTAQPGQPGPAQQAFMDVLAKINQRLGQ